MRRPTTILTFHGIGRPRRALADGEAGVWVEQDRFLSLLDVVAGRDDVRVTFDDGNASDVERALPALARRGLTAAFFVVAGRLGRPGFLDAAGVRELAAAGMTVGCHGMRHRPWRTLDAPALHEEIVDARRVLEDVVGGPVSDAACPFGSYDRRVLHALRRGAYGHVYTSDRGIAREGDWLLPRTTVRATDDAGQLGRLLAARPSVPATMARRAALAIKRWR